MPKSYLADPDLQAYFFIFKSSQGHNPIAQQWALSQLFARLKPYVNSVANLLLGWSVPANKTELYLASQKINNFWKEDLIQQIYLCILYVFRKQKLKNTNRIHDYMNLVLRELFNKKSYSLNK
tara:strand:+ start:674 stop:1042 length:369 start_codon:yes stop_codon:yes gene_type:complete